LQAIKIFKTETEYTLKALAQFRRKLAIQTMKLNYYSDTDSLYIDLSERPSVESREISEGIVLDYDATGSLVGIDIDNASQKVDLKKLTLNKLPAIIQNNPA
jgi:uncharacterized protein YuzE